MRGILNSGQQRRILLQAVNVALAGLIPLAFVYFAAQYVGHVVTIRNVDYFQFVEMAQGLGSGSLRSWVGGMHPVGYPLLIRWGLAWGLDAAQIGHALSIAGGVILLTSAYLLGYQLTHNRWLALLTEGFLATTGYFLYFATFEGNDMLSAGLQGLSLALLVGLSERKGTNFAAGVLAGLAYVIRYTAIVTSGLCLLFLAGRALVQRRRSTWIVTGLFLAGFLLGAALQLIPSALVTGNPFYSVRGHDVWWHVEGRTSFATEWNDAPMDISPVEVFLANPKRFIQHWWNTARSFWVSPRMLLLDTPLRLLAQAGLLFTLLAGREIEARQRGLLALYVGGLLAALAVIRYDPRFLVIILPVLIFCAVYFVWAIVPRCLSLGRLTLPTGAIVLVVLIGWSGTVPLSYLRDAPASSEGVLAVTNSLRAAGMRLASEVLSSGIPFHDASVPTRTRYDQSYWVAPNMDSLEELHALAEKKGYHFVLYDAQTGLAAHPGLEDLLNPNRRPSGLTPLLIPEDREYALYRLESDPPKPAHPLDVQLDDDIALRGYDLYVTRDAPEMVVPRVGVFLYWQATQPISCSYKVFVHVLNADGRLIAQDDSLPVLWTYPTDAWQGGEDVLDFHSIVLPADAIPGTYTVQAGMYEEQTMQRLSVSSSAGAAVDDKAVLTKITLGASEIEGRQKQ
jgi:hypothetical protein